MLSPQLRLLAAHRPSSAVLTDYADRFAAWLLEEPTNARSLLTLVYPELAHCIDWPHARLQPRNLLLPDLSRREADVLWLLRTSPLRPDPLPGQRRPPAPRPWSILLPVEHKSRPVSDTPVQLLHYSYGSWVTQLRAGLSPRRLPLLRGIVLYTGRVRWHRPLSFQELLAPPTLLGGAGLETTTRLLDLCRLAPEQLEAQGSVLGWCLRLWQGGLLENQGRFAETLDRTLGGLEQLSEATLPEGIRAGWHCLQTVFHLRTAGEYNRLAPRVLEWGRTSRFGLEPEIETMRRTAAQDIRESGIQSGIQIGEARGIQVGGAASLRKVLRDVLDARFPGAAGTVAGELETAGIPELSAWLEAVALGAGLEVIGKPAPHGANGSNGAGTP
jgi:hypothetical protein